MKSICKSSVRHLQSAPGDSASKHISERIGRTIVELTRTNLNHAGAPQNLLVEATSLVVFGLNNLSTYASYRSAGKMVSPVNLMESNDRNFDISILRAFGTTMFLMLTVQKKGWKENCPLPQSPPWCYRWHRGQYARLSRI